MEPMTYETYLDAEARWPSTGRVVLAHQTPSHVVVYQAYNPTLATAIVAAQCLHAPSVVAAGYSLQRMTWIKPNFLWMMFRSKWATARNQERILALYVHRAAFNQLITDGVLSACDDGAVTRDEWTQRIQSSNIRLQWDPDHVPDGSRHLGRRALQIGLRGDALLAFSSTMVDGIVDVTDFVASQRPCVAAMHLDALLVPREDVFEWNPLEPATSSPHQDEKSTPRLEEATWC
ncbi:hypothetical protein SPRG_09034 [Saprolegnia parasitica CBS 223.65]|uniref:DUF4291 domain-containing protein n=1 Tax=Saprolegnia parasitica (strain CBS 223.65) TaxID=695850 RepID=A0A067C9B9_SAPPC|nr:hypothetical protein SPRG_09034 [Saprolegnia parasitica CBS 223.65]KDO25735.1 hypothetical protein SPRG_09034 [Saprolegnia parasitica CBS 223.65]|eukprot:XP_012203544.1 hypothetical protein SPRG_09034 [Saprolegnia parasitica CBS 223.65]